MTTKTKLPKRVVWAVYTWEKDVTGKKSEYVCLREIKQPMMNIPYASMHVSNFTQARKWADEQRGFAIELHYAKVSDYWDNEIKRFIYGKVIELKAPEMLNKRGAAICEECGGKTRSVLDGEAWCSHCERYQ